MNERASKALLPAGLRDVLPPDAAFEAAVSERLMSAFARNGYLQVNPPLVEFEESFLGGAGTAMTQETFRLMDPVSQRMLAVRSDMTLQVARIASTRLTHAPRPLRLAYAGQVLRVKGSQLRPQRQFRQAGLELIGAASSAADAEVILMAVSALQDLGLARLTVDLNLPTLVPAVCAAFGMPAAMQRSLRLALDRKDAGTMAELAGDRRDVLLALLDAAGPAEEAIARLGRLDLPAAGAAAVSHLAEIVALVRREAPDLHLTVDPVEHRGFEYHTGTSFSLFARRVRGEIGRGGRYLAGGEPATGVTLFMDAVHRAVPRPDAPARLYLPFGTPAPERRRLQDDGWVTVAGLEPVSDPIAEAKRLECSHVLLAGGPAGLEDRR